ncbi:DUF58 domain-containing protein [Propionivibrio soli]|uniref:DUF58 domain-containing protein n=1 Tax=Propionivibrio soli TaxID=2976531 RepID=UPI0021E8B18B
MIALLKPFRQWLFRFGVDEQTPIVLTQRRVFIVPSRGGLLFAIVLAAMLLGAINYTLSLGHALVFLLASLGLVTMVHTFRNLAGLHITPGHPDPVFAGETARFPLVLDSHSAHWRRSLELAFGTHDGAFASIPPGERAVIEVPYPAPRRGRLRPGRLTLSTRYPLGLFRAWAYPHPRLECLVYPKPIETPLPTPLAVSHAGQHHGGSGQEDFTGLRERQPSDSPRHIAWKAVARDMEQRPLLTKQFAGGAAEELWFDLDQTSPDMPLETRLSVLTGWVLAAEQVQLRYGVRLPGRRVLPEQGPSHRDVCLEALALYGEEPN